MDYFEMRQHTTIAPTIKGAVKELRERELEGGGFSLKKGGPYQPDATAWAVIALDASGEKGSSLSNARKRLAGSQKSDGRVVFSSRLREAFWATPLAIFAWIGHLEFTGPMNKAVEFLLTTAGLHWENKDDPTFGHDTSLKGWPWIQGTHSWIEPTSLTLLALKAARTPHERKEEAVRMIVNRQLSSGGWNYGNTTVFGTELRPIPVSTGLALDALSGLVERERVRQSLEYMKSVSLRIRTPLSLSWMILGLGSWSERPLQAEVWIKESLELQNRYGSYETDLLSQLIIAHKASGGLLSVLENPEIKQ